MPPNLRRKANFTLVSLKNGCRSKASSRQLYSLAAKSDPLAGFVNSDD